MGIAEARGLNGWLSVGGLYTEGCEEHILVTTIPAGSEPKAPRPQGSMWNQQHDSDGEKQGVTPLFVFICPIKYVLSPIRIRTARN